jgi:hypothetical protein
LNLGLAWVYQSFGKYLCNTNHANTFSSTEFKEIRKEWKARKKEEENQRKAEEERARAAAVPAEGQGENPPPAGYPQGARSVQLPPIGYQPGASVPGQYQTPSGGVQQLQDYSNNNHLQYGGYPASPYGAPNQMYSQRHYTLISVLEMNDANMVHR